MIDTSNWKEFKLSDLFDVKNSKSISDKRGLDFDEKNPYDFIGRTPVNNGIQGKIVKQDFEPNNENTFSITQIGEKLCLFRDNKWYACQNIFLLTPLYPELITAKFFICCVVTKTLKAVFGEDAYSSYPTKDTLSDMMVKLPAKPDGEPDWNYMESYMKAVMEESEKSLENLKKADDTKHLIDVSGWGEFSCKELFECKNTGNILARDVIDGSGNTPYVTASGYNNGVVAHIDASNYEIIKGHCILVGGKTFTITYQKDDFVSNDSHNFTIRVKDYDISDLSYLYLTSMIYTYFGQKYSWNDAVTKDKLLDENIPLPITSTGEPDWKYMEDYMRRIMDKSEQIISDLQIGA